MRQRTFDLRDREVRADLERDGLTDLQVGESFVLQLTNQASSAGWFYQLDEAQANNLLTFVKEDRSANKDQPGGRVLLGASGLSEYTVTVIGAGDGLIKFDPMSSRNPGEPETMFPSIAINFTAQ